MFCSFILPYIKRIVVSSEYPSFHSFHDFHVFAFISSLSLTKCPYRKLFSPASLQTLDTFSIPMDIVFESTPSRSKRHFEEANAGYLDHIKAISIAFQRGPICEKPVWGETAERPLRTFREVLYQNVFNLSRPDITNYALLFGRMNISFQYLQFLIIISLIDQHKWMENWE